MMADELAYDLTGVWDLHYNANPSSSNFDTHQTLNFVRDGPVITDGPNAFRARFISRVAGQLGEVITHAEVFTGVRSPTQVSPPFPLTVVAFYQGGPGAGGRPPYYSSWSGCLIVDYHTDPKHPRDTKVFRGYLAGIELDRGQFEMKRRS
jgi:hypothetical protein